MPTLTPARSEAATHGETAPRARSSRTHRGVEPWASRVEFGAAALLGVLAVALHVRFVTNVGALWRDEANSVNVANLSSYREIFGFLDYDSFPMLFFAVLRTWTAMWGPGNDVALRTLGCVIGVAIMAALWLNARTLGARWPVLSIALLGLNPMIIRYGDSVRAYGLGILLILLTFRAFWRIADPAAPLSARRVLAGTVFAVLSVQCLYYNSVLLLAIGAGAAAVALRARDWRKIGVVIGIGTVAALSILPYVPMMRRMRAWTFLVSYPCDFAWIWKRLGEVTGSPDPLGVWIWAGLFIVALLTVGAAFFLGRSQRFVRNGTAPADPTGTTAAAAAVPAPVLFAAVTALVGVVGYTTFLNVLNYYTQPWYYVTMVAFVACALDVVFGAWRESPLHDSVGLAARGLRVAVAVALLGLGGTAAWEELPTRHTNVDVVAAHLEPITQKGDLILVPRWECAIPFTRYYHGPAEMMTLPPIEDHRFHRYDLVLQHMMNAESVEPILARMEQTLRSGRRIFIVGDLPYPAPDAVLPKLPPFYADANGGWRGAPPNSVWRLRAGGFIRAHATEHAMIHLNRPRGTRVADYEDLELSVASGWE